MRAAFKIFYAALPSVPYFGCFTHKLDWVFQDILVVPWVQRLLGQCKRVIHVFRRHQRIRVAFVEIAGLVILKHGDTRHGTWYIVIHRILEVKYKLQEFTSSPIFEEESKVSSKRALYKDVRRLLVAQEGIYRHISTRFWADCDRFIFLMRPSFRALKVSDMNTPQLGHLYPLISKAARHIKTYDSDMHDASYKICW